MVKNTWYTVTDLFDFMMYSKGRRKSFWKRKLASSPFSMNFIDNWRRESTAKNDISSTGLQPTWCGGQSHRLSVSRYLPLTSLTKTCTN